jgi:hypothetical protein
MPAHAGRPAADENSVTTASTVDAPADPGGATDASPTDPGTPAGRAGIPWSTVGRWAVAGTLIMLMVVLVDVRRNGGGNPVSLVQPGAQGPAHRLFDEDFPDLEVPDGVGLDGQLYYAVARDPFHLDTTADHLDRPRYREQRPLLSWMAWVLHPTGGGTGLVLALVAAGIVGLLLLGLGGGALSTALGGPAWIAALAPLLPGAYWSLRVSVSDALALALALLAVALSARNRHLPAVAVGVLAVLAKEPAILVLVGWAAWRRDRTSALLVAVPAAVVVGWMGWLRVQLPADPDGTADLGLPFVGLVDAWSHIWSEGRELVGMACTLVGLAAGTTALALRRLRHPLGWAIALQLGFLLCMGENPTGINFGSTRMTLPVMVLAVVALATPNAATQLRPASDAADAAPATAPGAAPA